jgi:hypothetical protein
MPVAIELSAEEQERYRRTHWAGAALKAGLLAGAIVWLFPAGNPWTSYMFPVHVMGRPITSDASMHMLSIASIPGHVAHFAVSVLYAFVLLGLIYRLRSWKAIVAGMVGGAVLYAIQFGVFRAFAPQFTGSFELNVILAHLLFGGIAAGAMRGFLRAPQKLDISQPNPGPQYP